jgi:hypothetical protein
MQVHIGKVIKGIVREKQLDVTEFASKISYTRRNIYKIFGKSSIDTELLAKISKVLGQNLFFAYISDEEIIKYRNNKVKSGELLTNLKEIKEEIAKLSQVGVKKNSLKRTSKNSSIKEQKKEK